MTEDSTVQSHVKSYIRTNKKKTQSSDGGLQQETPKNNACLGKTERSQLLVAESS